MTESSGPACALVDWGTSRVRLWLVDRLGAAVAERRSDEGMGRLAPNEFAGVLERLLADAGAGSGMDVMMCGMVGSRQGWEEARYLPTPARLADLAAQAHFVDHERRRVAILPGVADFSSETPDVIRGEETKLLGLLASGAITGDELVCMPGTHAKWAQIDANAGVVDAFATSLSGDLYAALSKASVLRHSVGEGPVDPNDHAFADGVSRSLADPATILSRLFGVRARSLVHNDDEAASRAFLSGTVIGQDIAGAMARFGRPERVRLIGSGVLGALYGQALSIAEVAFDLYDGDALVREGLVAAARQRFEDAFAGPMPA